MTSAALFRALVGWTMLCFLSGCVFTKQPPYPVNTHSSTPVDQRADQDEYARIADQTAVVAFEYGRCQTDSDCAPRGCNHAVCAPAGLGGLCVKNRVGACLAQVPTSLCGCTDEGVCRWTRNNLVMQCAGIPYERVQTRPYRGAMGHTYPWRPYK